MDDYLLQEMGIETGTSYLDDQGFAPLPAFTDEDALAAVVPNYTAEETAAAPIMQAEEDPYASIMGGQLEAPTLGLSPEAPQPTPQQAPELGKVSSSLSTKESGFSTPKNQQVRQSPSAVALTADNAATEAKGAADQAMLTDMFGKANNLATQAVDSQTLAQQEYDQEAAAQTGLMAAERQKYATKMEEAQAQAQALSASRKADYVAALNEQRAMVVDPSQLWGNMSQGQQVGMIAAAFVQDYLGVKGMKSSAMDTFNKAIDRNIHSQLENIRNKGEVAQGFKTLWDMQRAESSSEAEAMARMRGFMLDSFQLQVEQHMAQFASGLTAAKGEAAKAKLHAEQAKNIFEVYKHVDDATAKGLDQNLRKYATDLSNSIAKSDLYLKQQTERRLAAQQARENASDPYSGLIFDDSESGGGAARWEFTTKDPEQRRKYTEAHSGAGHYRNLSREYREMVREYGGLTDPLAKTRWQDVKAARMQAIASELVGIKVKRISGAAATDSERKIIAMQVPIGDLLGKEKQIESVVAQTEGHMTSELTSLRRPISRDLAKDDPRRTLRASSGNVGEAEFLDATITARNEGEANLSPAQKDHQAASELIAGPIAYKSPDTGNQGPPAHVEAAHLQFRKEFPGHFAKLAASARDATGGSDKIPNMEYGLNRLAFAAEKGHQESRKKLEFLAEGYRRGDIGMENDVLGAYASMLLQNVDGGKVVSPAAPPPSSEIDPRTAQQFLDALENGPQ